MASKQLELVQRMEKEAWVKLRKATENYEPDDKRLLRLRARWTALSDALDNLVDIEDSEDLDEPMVIKIETVNDTIDQRIAEAYEKIAYMVSAYGQESVQALCARREWYGMKKLEETIRSKEHEMLNV